MAHKKLFNVTGLEVAVRGGAMHDFEEGETDPIWGASLGYTWREHDAFEFEVGYASVLTVDEFGELDVERAATASLRIKFGPAT